MNEVDLIAGLKSKDLKSLRYLYDNYAKTLLGVIYRFISNKEMAEEVLQDVMVKIWSRADQYDASKGRLFTWMINISRNAAIDKTRSKDFIESNKNYPTEDFVDILKSNLSSDRNLDSIGLKKLLNQLDQKYLDILDLVYFKGYTQREAAEKLDLPPGTLKTRLRACISELRTQIEI